MNNANNAAVNNSNNAAVEFKPYLYASALVGGKYKDGTDRAAKSDIEIQLRMLELKLTNKMPNVFDDEDNIITDPTVEQFKAFLIRSRDFKQAKIAKVSDNKEAKEFNKNLEAKILELQKQRDELNKEITFQKTQYMPVRTKIAKAE